MFNFSMVWGALASLGLIVWYLVRVTEFKRQILQELEIRTVELLKCREAVQAWDHFAAMASHELKTPLSVLTIQNGLSEKLLEKLQIRDDQLSAVFKQGRYSISRLNHLVEQFVEFSRVGRGELSLTLKQMDLAAHTEKLVRHLESGGFCTPGLVSVSVESNPHGNWDQGRIEQVLINLISNAVKYGQGKPISVRILDSSHPEWIRIQVKDQGTGIELHEQEKIFERFERTEEARRMTTGLGLGLFISKSIVEAHRGKISVNSEPSFGSEFTIDLPRGNA